MCCAKTALAARRRAARRVSPSSGAPLTARHSLSPAMRSSGDPCCAAACGSLTPATLKLHAQFLQCPETCRAVSHARGLMHAVSCTRSHARGLMHAASCTRSGCARDATPDDFALCSWHCTRAHALAHCPPLPAHTHAHARKNARFSLPLCETSQSPQARPTSPHALIVGLVSRWARTSSCRQCAASSVCAWPSLSRPSMVNCRK